MTKHATPSVFGRLKRSKVAIATLGVVGILAVGGTAVSALWVDTAAVETTITTGTVDINVDGNEGNPTAYTFTLPITQFAPGVTTSKTLTVKNNGTLPVTLAMSTANSAGAGGLATALTSSMTLSGTAAYSGALSAATFTAKPLAPGASAPLAITVTAPAGLANTFQGKTDTITFTFTAEQAN